ncbi:hypothetical protein Cni_G23120 [Canna indica]|uniref:AN1-type domain-containing protein n=1 Tax=Canna indica TaxID=4628 RepID=A0AAQ3QNA4_9LILI|nr:hypothetical protein Cni_G23120 [Canna indica]
MAGESCNLDKDEAEIFKPSSASSPSASPPSPPSSASPPPPAPLPPSSMNLKPCEKSAVQRSKRPQSPPREMTTSASSKPKLDEEPRTPVKFSNRCSTCRKRVGLTGFRCRCGDLFCGRHRYSDAHECSFDYKAAGREEIAKANPVIKAAKIIKI